jgi:hypothetical protein
MFVFGAWRKFIFEQFISDKYLFKNEKVAFEDTSDGWGTHLRAKVGDE